MKTSSMVQLLEVGNFLFHKQTQFKKILDVEYELLAKEIKLVLKVILMSMGIVQGDGGEKNSYIVNTDHYEHLIQKFYAYCRDEVSKEEMVDLIYALSLKEGQYVVNGISLAGEGNPRSINVLFDLKYSLQTMRQKVAHIVGGECDFLRAEKKVVQIALDELGNRRYFETAD